MRYGPLMASCDPLRETQEFEAKRDALRRAVSAVTPEIPREKRPPWWPKRRAS